MRKLYHASARNRATQAPALTLIKATKKTGCHRDIGPCIAPEAAVCLSSLGYAFIVELAPGLVPAGSSHTLPPSREASVCETKLMSAGYDVLALAKRVH